MHTLVKILIFLQFRVIIIFVTLQVISLRQHLWKNLYLLIEFEDMNIISNSINFLFKIIKGTENIFYFRNSVN